jgi:DNA-binding transcriptional ArsR family regulator
MCTIRPRLSSLRVTGRIDSVVMAKLLERSVAMSSIDSIFRALAATPRRAIVERLSHGPQTVNELAAHIESSLSATLQHIAQLEESGLVKSEKLGRTRTCQLNAKTFEKAEQWFGKRRVQLEKSFDRLDKLLQSKRDLDG